jgi:hypothetical protein
VAALTRIGPSSAPAGAHRPESIRFCSRCARQSDAPSTHLQVARRVCDRCESGVLLSARRDALMPDAAALVICTYELTITAVSEAAERFIGAEDRLLGTDLLDHLSCPLGDEQLARHAALAAQRPREPVALPLLLRAEQPAGTLAGRIGTCGPPRAALLSVEPSPFGRR